MTTVFNSLVDNGGLQNDPYQSVMEIIAPGITGILNTVRLFNEPWPATLSRILPFLQLTPDQLTLIQAEITNATNGVAPPATTGSTITIAGETINAGTQPLVTVSSAGIPALNNSALTQLSIIEIISGISAALAVIKWITG